MPRRKKKIFIVAGEASGDIYGALVARELKMIASVEMRGWGGEEMTASGVEITKHYRELAFMGLYEVLVNLKKITGNLNRCWEEIEAFNPDALILVDFPGFNMRIAKKAHKKGINTFQLVAPKIWAWKAGRIKQLAENYTAVFPILPFEDKLLKSGGVNSIYCGHPLLDSIGVVKEHSEKTKVLALLPGSRKQEIKKILPFMIEAAAKIDGFTIVIAGAPGLDSQDYKTANDAGVKVVFGETRELLKRSEIALITSGTATLEAALLDTPHVLVYKTSKLTFLAAKAVVSVEHIGLPNLILGRELVPELIQGDCTSNNITNCLKTIADNPSAQLKGFEEIRRKLGDRGASKEVAKRILEIINPS
tara:strand:- start:1029 stop:2117 length:1089 start_codon:yes stop_codon:yes gene_type:complete